MVTPAADGMYYVRIGADAGHGRDAVTWTLGDDTTPELPARLDTSGTDVMGSILSDQDQDWFRVTPDPVITLVPEFSPHVW